MRGMPVGYDVDIELLFKKQKIQLQPQTHKAEGALMQAHTNRIAYLFAIGMALTAACLLIWLSLGVGVIGKDGDPANLMYFGVIAVGIIGALTSRFRSKGMVSTLLAMALAQALVAALALIAELGLPWSGPVEIILLNGFFVAMFAGSAWLFKRAAPQP